jgi:isopentenyl-diphosphate delta-isomerase
MKQRPSPSAASAGDYLVLVDKQGRVAGRERKDVCHRGPGLLHAAFLVMMFAENDSLILARRSPSKALWPGYWDGTVASHYFHNGDRPATVRDRVRQEIGLKAETPALLFRFQYQASYDKSGSEHELCDVYVLGGVRPENLCLDPSEISDFRLAEVDTLKREIAAGADSFTPWLLIALKNLERTHSGKIIRRP